jgi:hypothetical protein
VPHFSHTHLFIRAQVWNLQLEKKGEREGHPLERTFCIGLSYSLDTVLDIYDKEVFAGFSSP